MAYLNNSGYNTIIRYLLYSKRHNNDVGIFIVPKKLDNAKRITKTNSLFFSFQKIYHNIMIIARILIFFLFHLCFLNRF